MTLYLSEAIDFAVTNGLIKYNADYELTHAPFSLTPCVVGVDVQQELCELTPIFNALWMKMANSPAFLRSALEKTARTDDFIAGLLKLLPDGNPAASHQLLISRNDFLLAEAPGHLQPKQVEFNTISNSFLALSRQVILLHRHLHQKGLLPCSPVILDPLEEAVDAMADVVKRYGYPDACMLMVVQEPEQNIFDQRAVEYRLQEKYQIQTIRMTLEEIAQAGRLKEGHLEVKGRIAALTYFRAGYTPADYTETEAWKARELIENASSVKCPSIGMQLAGAKKIQQLLGMPDTLRQFADKGAINRIQATFAGLYALDDKLDGMSAAETAGLSPDKYVLKPQREGGGNNLYGEELKQKLGSMSNAEKDAFILMERIDAISAPAELVVEAVSEELESISEIGRYGICLAEGDKLIQNRDAGYLVRTKAADINEGGVCAGYACLNSLCTDD